VRYDEIQTSNDEIQTRKRYRPGRDVNAIGRRAQRGTHEGKNDAQDEHRAEQATPESSRHGTQRAATHNPGIHRHHKTQTGATSTQSRRHNTSNTAPEEADSRHNERQNRQPRSRQQTE